MSGRDSGIEYIEDSDTLFRRLHTACIKADGKTVSSLAFMTDGFPDAEASVDLAKLTSEAESVNRAPTSGFRLGKLIAGEARDHGHQVIYDPIEQNRSHSLIMGISSKKEARALAREVRIIQDVISD